MLWIAGDGVPAGLRLDLPHGRRQPMPALTSALPVTPAFFVGGGPATAVESVLPESPAALVHAHLLQRRLHRALRLDTGLSYTTAVEYAERGDGHAVLTAYADALTDKQGAVLGGFVDVLAGLLALPAAETELAAAVATAVREATMPDAAAGTLPSRAFRLLTDRPPGDVDSEVAALRAVTADAAHAAARAAHRTALLMTPPGGGAGWAGYVAAPTVSEFPAGGRSHAADGRRGPHIHLSADSVSAVDPAAGSPPCGSPSAPSCSPNRTAPGCWSATTRWWSSSARPDTPTCTPARSTGGYRPGCWCPCRAARPTNPRCRRRPGGSARSPGGRWRPSGCGSVRWGWSPPSSAGPP